MPRSSQRSSLGLAVPNHHAHNQAGVIERGPKRVRDAIAQLATLVNRPWNFGRAVTPQLAWKRKRAEQFQHSCFVLALLRVDLGVRPFQIAVRDHGRRTVSRTRQVDHVQIVFADDAVQMDPRKSLAWIGAPMSEQPILDVFGAKRLLEQRIVAQINHSCREIVAGFPVSVDLAKFLRGQRRFILGSGCHRGCLKHATPMCPIRDETRCGADALVRVGPLGPAPRSLNKFHCVRMSANAANTSDGVST